MYLTIRCLLQTFSMQWSSNLPHISCFAIYVVFSWQALQARSSQTACFDTLTKNHSDIDWSKQESHTHFPMHPPMHHPSGTNAPPFTCHDPSKAPSKRNQYAIHLHAMQPPRHHLSRTNTPSIYIHAMQPAMHHPTKTNAPPFTCHAPCNVPSNQNKCTTIYMPCTL